MSQPAALITGASRGIGYAIADLLGGEGYALTLSALRSEPLADAARTLERKGYAVEAFAADVASEPDVHALVSAHRRKFGRLDVLVNSAGVVIGSDVGTDLTVAVDTQVAVNLRSVILVYRECLDLLRTAGSEHGRALVVNLASYAGKWGQPWMAVYSATKAGVIAYSDAMNLEIGASGIKSVALCPGFVDTDMTAFARDAVPRENMIRPSDVAEAVRFALRLSPSCVIPELIFKRPGGIP